MIDELNQEGILKEESVAYFKKKMASYQGKIYLTPNRVVVMAKPLANNVRVGGLVGALVTMFIKSKTKEEVQVNIPLSELKSFEQGKIGINKNVLMLTDKNDVVYKVGVRKYADWDEALSGKAVAAE